MFIKRNSLILVIGCLVMDVGHDNLKTKIV